MTDREPLVIVGGGGHGREAFDLVEAMNRAEPRWRFVGFVSDGPTEGRYFDARVTEALGPVDLLDGLDARFVIAIGDSRVRRQVCERIGRTRRQPAVLVHPDSVVAVGVVLGAGSLVAAGVVVGSGSVIGNHVHLNVNASVGVDCRIGDHGTVSPGCVIERTAVIGDAVFVGVGATILEGRRVGDGAIIGAGSLVDHDVPDRAVVAGRPSRLIRLD